MTRDEPFSLFGIPRDADESTIRQAYARLSAEYSSDPLMTDRLSRAFAQLIDSEQRRHPNAPSRSVSNPPPRTTFDQLFNRIYSETAPPPPPRRPPPIPQPPQTDTSTLDIKLVVHCTLEEMFNQSVKLLTFVRRRESGECETRTVRITLTDGTEDHTTITLARQGHRDLGKTPGDVLITILQQPHERFARVGADLFEEARLSLRNVISGEFEISSNGVDGEVVTVKIEEIVQNGQELRVVGRGMKRKDGTRGDHVFQIVLSIPQLTAEQRSRLAEILSE
jgi:DnaJ-class molecular chaperone